MRLAPRHAKRTKISALLALNNSGARVGQSLLDGAPFYSDLFNTAIPQRAASGVTATFTRATAKTWKNNDGYLVTGLAGEIGFPGARRVRNLIPTSSSNATLSIGVEAGTTATATNIAFNIVVAYRYKQITAPGGRTYALSLKLKTSDGKGKIGFRTYSDGTGVVVQTQSVTLPSEWTRYTIIYTSPTDATYLLMGFDNRVVNGGDDSTTGSVDVDEWQIEDITGRADQTTPSEYVSVGALDYRSTNDPLYLDTAGAAAGSASTPDSAATSTTGDIALVFDGALTNWAALNTFASITSGGAGQLGWIFEQQAASSPRLRVFLDGTTQTLIPATATVPFANGVRGKIAVTRASSSGDVKFFTSSDGGSTWTQLGTTVSAAAGALFNSTSNLTINNERTFGPLTGRTYGFQMYSGIPPIFGGSGSATPVVDFNPHRDATTPTGTITSSTTGEVWTINGASSVVRNATYHGSFVDGVKCFNTDIDGNPLTTMERYKPESAATNLCLQSNSFIAWITYLTPTPTQNVIGPDGAVSAWTLTDNSAVDSEIVYQDFSLTAAMHTASIFVKKTNDAITFPVIRALQVSGVLAASCTIDTNNGVATVFTAAPGWTIVTSSASCISYNDDFWRVSLTFLATAAVWRVDLMPSASLTATNAAGWDNAAQGSAVFYGAQLELGSFATSYIATAGAAATRNADILTYSGGDVANFKTLMAGFRREVGVSDVGMAAALSDGTTSNYADIRLSSATIQQCIGTTGGAGQWAITASNAYVPGVDSSVAFSAATNDVKAAKDGVAQTQDTSATVPTVTQLNVGHLAGSYQLNGNVGPVVAWTRNLSQSELNAVTQ